MESANIVSYAKDVRPLFREKDRLEMEFLFDLWSYEDVHAHADSILGRLEDGTMPCDVPWAPDVIERFQRWIEQGCQP